MSAMTIKENNSVRNYFLAHARDVTPASARQLATVFFAPFSSRSELSGLCTRVLSQEELRQMQRKASRAERDEFAQRRAFRRFCAVSALGSSQVLTEPVFEETEKGRPYLRDEPELCFSFSSCRFGMLGAWSSTCRVGIDIEDHSRSVEALALARYFFSSAEAAVVEKASGTSRLKIFYRLWSLKEAALKSIGEGLPFGLDAFEFALHPCPHLVETPAGYGEAKQFSVHEIEQEKASAVLVTRNLREATESEALPGELSPETRASLS